MNNKIHTVIGLMSGTSLDGIDAALIRTDGRDFVERLGFITIPYEDALRDELRACLGKKQDDDGSVLRAERNMTLAHAAAVGALLRKTGKNSADIDLIGFHGQTIFHDPANKFTWQIGDGALLAQHTGIAVVNDFRSADVAAGGQGAPLIPLYHRALAAASSLPRPVAIVNIGGVSNVTYIGADDELLAFDTGPGNALMDDFMRLRAGKNYDEGGNTASKGEPDSKTIKAFLAHDFFSKPPPKSLDRDQWSIDPVKDFPLEDGMATLMAMTTGGIEAGFRRLPGKCRGIYVTGGGRKNLSLMNVLEGRLPRNLFSPVAPVEKLGWDGDALEAEGFGYLAARSVLGLPLSLPGTTGVPAPATGGRLHKADRAA